MRADLALVGLGNVGRRFAQLIDERRDDLASAYDLTCRIVGVATRRHGSAWWPEGIGAGRLLAGPATMGEAGSHDATTGPPPVDSFEVIERLAGSDADLRVVVETTTLDIAAGQPAVDHVRAAFASGSHVVTANKGPVAFAYASLRDQAEAAGVSFLFEGTVMDGIPIFNLVRETLPAVVIRGFRGVVNSTTNHILSALEDGEDFAGALGRMQAEGIAEADASLDVEGWDAAAKTAALANVLMNARITPQSVERTGIDERCGTWARSAKERGRRLRLVASATLQGDGGVIATVQPIELPGEDLLAGLRGQANALILTTDLLGEIGICQMGGGLTQTAYALLSDLITIRKRQSGRPLRQDDPDNFQHHNSQLPK